jgi:hypothetical protein
MTVFVYLSLSNRNAAGRGVQRLFFRFDAMAINVATTISAAAILADGNSGTVTWLGEG